MSIGAGSIKRAAKAVDAAGVAQEMAEKEQQAAEKAVEEKAAEEKVVEEKQASKAPSKGKAKKSKNSGEPVFSEIEQLGSIPAREKRYGIGEQLPAHLI